jgi:DNA invertase Pin-like site-specific DNA recombinase/regulator of replication initiation timing
MADVTVIPAVQNRIPRDMPQQQMLKVAAYARVSTDSDEQETSYDAQCDYYTQYIRSRSDWIFAGLYSDEARSGLMTKRRDGFNQMVQDALNGKIDRIVTKSVARFARNTVDSLSTIRKLKAQGIAIFFEKENIDTMDGKSELLITLMSSLAQEESRSISENVTWGQRKRFSDGKFTLPYARFLGYGRGEDGFPAVIESEAETVRLIYRLFLEGNTPNGIANTLTELNISTPGGKDTWSVSTVKSILTNEKYTGCALLQKGITVDFLTKKRKVNEGEAPQYFVKDSHEAIISPEVFEMVKLEMKRRREVPGYKGKNVFCAKLICGECGSPFGAKVWHSTDKYRCVIYRCNAKYDNGHKCSTTHFTEEDIQTRFTEAVNRLLTERDELFAVFEDIRKTIFDTSDIDSERDALSAEINVVAELVQKCVDENARTKLDQTEYRKRYDALVVRYDAAKARLDELSELSADKKLRERQVLHFFAELRNAPSMISEYDERLWHTLLERAEVCLDGRVRFIFRDESEVYV